MLNKNQTSKKKRTEKQKIFFSMKFRRRLELITLPPEYDHALVTFMPARYY